MQKTVLDISCESLDLYFARQIEGITEVGKSSLPRDIAFKLFRKGGDWDAKSTSRLGFISKLFVLLRALKKRSFLLVEDHKDGIGVDQFMALRESGAIRDYSMEVADRVISCGGIVLANKELSDFFQYLNNLSTSPAYNYLLRNKNVPPNRIDAANNEMAYIVRFLVFWEGHKKDLVANTGLSMPEVYIMMCLFDGKEHEGKEIYQGTFRRAYQSSPGKIRLAFATLQHKGYIKKFGVTYGAKLQITPLGKDILRQAIYNYGINC